MIDKLIYGFLILLALCLRLMAQNLTVVPLSLKEYKGLPSGTRNSSLYTARCDHKIQKMYFEVVNVNSTSNEMYSDKKYNDCTLDCILDCTLELFSSSCTCEGVWQHNSKKAFRNGCICEKDWVNYETTVTIKTTHQFNQNVNQKQSVKFKLSKDELLEPLRL